VSDCICLGTGLVRDIPGPVGLRTVSTAERGPGVRGCEDCACCDTCGECVPLGEGLDHVCRSVPVGARVRCGELGPYSAATVGMVVQCDQGTALIQWDMGGPAEWVAAFRLETIARAA